jgi:hypothetical protein
MFIGEYVHIIRKLSTESKVMSLCLLHHISQPENYLTHFNLI